MNKGRQAGTEGVVDIVGYPQFGAQVLFWNEDTVVSSVNNTGQGDGDIGDSLGLIENGNVILRGKVRKDLFPFPAILKNAQGTVTFYCDKAPVSGTGQADVKMTATFRIEKVSQRHDEKTETMWDITIAGQRVGDLVPSGFAGDSRQPSTTARTAGNKYLYEGRQKLYDPNSLVDMSDQMFNVWGISADTDAAEVTAITGILAAYSTAPQTGEKQHTATCHRLSSAVVRVRVHWQRLDTKDQRLFPITWSKRTAVNGYSDSVGSLVLSGTNSLATQANLLYLAFTAQNYQWALTLSPATDGQRVAKYEYLNPGIEERISAQGSKWIEVKASGTNSQVYISQNIAGGTGFRKVRFSRVRVDSRKVRTFIIKRHLHSPTVPEDSGSSIGGYTLPDIGKVNSDTFQGVPATQCLYDGPDLTVHLGMPGISSYPMIAGWKFKTDSAGFFENVPEGMFTHVWELATNYTGSGWTNVQDLGEPFASITQAGTASFAAFVVPPA